MLCKKRGNQTLRTNSNESKFLNQIENFKTQLLEQGDTEIRPEKALAEVKSESKSAA